MNKGRNLTKQFDRYASVPHVHTCGPKIVSSVFWKLEPGVGGGGVISRLPKSNPFFLLVHRFTDKQLCLLNESLQLLPWTFTVTVMLSLSIYFFFLFFLFAYL